MTESFNEKRTTWSKFGAFVEHLPGWVLPCLIGAAIIGAALVYLWPSYTEFPMDDTYIHFVYAQNLAEQGKLFFSFPNEKGVATSSLLWVLLLAAGYKAGISMHLLAKLIGVASLVVVGVGVYGLLRPIWHPFQAFGAAMLVSLSGNMLWFSLSGMETIFFLALGILSLLAYRAGRWGWLSLVLGLLTLTRPEGLFLAGAIGLVELFSRGWPRRGLVLAVVIALLACAPWYGYLKWRTGHFLPTSASAKQFGSAVATDYLLKQYKLPGELAQFSRLMYPGLWVAYLLEFGMGGMALPAPKLTVGGAAGSPGMYISVWFFPAAALIIWLMYLSGKHFFALRKWRDWTRDPHKGALLILFVWAVLHNLAYMLLLPIPGTASRYGAINYIILWIAIVAGCSYLARIPLRRLAVGLGLLSIAAANSIYWNAVYDANLEHMLNARIAAARYVRATFAEEEQCAAFDVGSIRYYGERPIVELAALMDPGGGDKFLAGGADDYIVERGVTCLILPGRTGEQTEGLLDFASIMGLTTSPLFEMKLVKVFEIDRERWVLGYLPTVNYQASVTIYRLEMK